MSKIASFPLDFQIPATRWNSYSFKAILWFLTLRGQLYLEIE